MTSAQHVVIKGRTYKRPAAPTVVICIDGSEPAYIERAMEAVADDFARLVVEKTKKLKYGDPADPTVDVGAVIIHKGAAKTFETRVNDAVSQGEEIPPPILALGVCFLFYLISRSMRVILRISSEHFALR